MLGSDPKTGNPAGNPKITPTKPEQKNAEALMFAREDFLNDLKKVVKKLPPDHPSRSDSQKR